MRCVRKTAMALLVGLTVFSTLAAGTPHFQCHCPNGRLKPICVSSPTRIGGCCCGGDCCGSDKAAATTTSNAEKHCCCCASQDINPKKASERTGPALRATCCSKTLVLPAAQALPDPKIASPDF